MRFVFFGTPHFSVAILEKLINSFYQPLLIVTQPDKPAGRNNILSSPPTKDVATYHDIPLLQPSSLADIQDDLNKLNLDLIIVAAYGDIIPESILKIPKFGVLNVHPSLLPHYRGASPIQAAILNGDKRTGTTIMKMDAELDHGEIVLQKKITITVDETFTSLQAKLAHISADVLVKIIPDYLSGRLKSYPQRHNKATFTKTIKKEDAKIDWHQPAKKISQMIRAYEAWPRAWTILPNDKRCQIIKARIAKEFVGGEKFKPGQIIFKNNKTAIFTKDLPLELLVVQIEGKDPISGEDFSRGYSNLSGLFC